MDRYSFLNTINHQQIEILYKKYLEDPDSIEHSWRAFFQGFDFYKEKYYFCQFRKKSVDKEINVLKLINFYKKEGHLFAKINPISEKIYYPTPTLKKFFLEKEDLDKIFFSSKEIGLPPCTLREIIGFLKNIYCESIGLEYMYLYNPEQINWINNWINNPNKRLYNNEKFKILININKATKFEKFIHTKFVGQKRFSIEGNESILPAINYIIEYSSINYPIKDFVIGMSHRGRLNILCNILKKNCKKLFSEFFGKEYIEKNFLGDVKYHLGDNIYLKNKIGREINIINVPNSSHLESVYPIVEGIVRAKIDNDYNCNFNKVIPILIHGDAAFSAQGIAYEVIQMSLLEGYKTGGTIHIIVNNQIGFTTNCSDSRSSIYCTDLAKVILSPVIHVNSDDVESVIYSIRFAIDFRMSYNQDVFVDLLGYRKYGHNEGDDPRFTQPNFYKIIDIYKNQLNKLISKKKIKFYEKKYKNYLNNGFIKSKFEIKTKLNNFIIAKVLINVVKTNFKKNLLLKIGNKIYNVPKNKNIYNKTVKFLKIKKKKLLKTETVDWGIAELLAYGSLLYEGYNIRLSGEDVERGTFAHRHIVIISEFEEKIYLLNNIHNGQGKLYVYNSLLSEYGVLGFEYGYSMFNTNTLTVWEAQFGDFSNSAQIIIDQYLSSAETKWKIKNSIVLLLPHGDEGQGSEHSSSRIERYLQLCAYYNMFICNCSTPSNFYHLLRRQIKFYFIKPLIIFTPKSLLRNIQCISSLSELYNGKFEEFIDDKYVIKNYVDTLVFCSGKIYYDIFKKRKILNKKNIAIIRIEQLYPIINNLFEKILIQYTNKRKIIWVQEEPENMGVWPYLFRKYSKIPWILISPTESSAPSIGRNNFFLKTYLKLINKVFNT